MSLAALAWAWDQSVKPASTKLVLLCLADVQNAEDGRCFPSAIYIAGKTGLDKKTVYKAIEQLDADGLISVDRAHGKSHRYSLNPTRKRVDPKTGVPEIGSTRKRVNTLPENGSTPDPKTGHEPVINQKGTLKEVSAIGGRTDLGPYEAFARFMWERIEPITKQNREPNFDKWANTIRLLCERDGRSLGDVAAVFEWANADNFWRNNILSPDKLRKQFPRLFAECSSKQRMRPENLAKRTQEKLDSIDWSSPL